MRNILKTGSPPRLATLLAGAALLGLVSQGVLAQSGDTISNLATLSYSVGAVAQPVIESSAAGNSISGVGNGTATSFTVDAKVDVLVAGGVITPATSGQTGATTPFTVQNISNLTLGYTLVASNSSAGAYTVNATGITDNINSAIGLSIYLDDGAGVPANAGDGVLSAAELAAGAITAIPTLAAGATANLVVLTDMPIANNGDAAVVVMKATAVWPTPLVPTEEPALVVAGAVITATAGPNTGGIDVVLADIAGVVADAGAVPAVTADIASDGTHSTYGAFSISSALLSVAKVATVICDPINGDTNPKNIPGAAVQYAITITNAAGGASATLTQVTDTLVAALGFDPGLISGIGAGTNCVAGTGNQSASGFGAISGAGVVTTYVAPGAAADATTAGATQAGGVVTIDFAALLGGSYGLAAGVLPANSFVTVYFNAFVQ